MLYRLFYINRILIYQIVPSTYKCSSHRVCWLNLNSYSKLLLYFILFFLFQVSYLITSVFMSSVSHSLFPVLYDMKRTTTILREKSLKKQEIINKLYCSWLISISSQHYHLTVSYDSILMFNNIVISTILVDETGSWMNIIY